MSMPSFSQPFFLLCICCIFTVVTATTNSIPLHDRNIASTTTTAAAEVASSAVARENIQSEYVILDVTGDSPSWSAVLMAMEATADENNPFNLLGIIATESNELESFHNLMDEMHLSNCLQVESCEEEELYPLEIYSLDTAPETVKQLVKWVDMYPGQVTIYASHSLVTVAYAAAVDPTFSKKVKELIIMSSIGSEPNYTTRGVAYITEDASQTIQQSPFLQDQEAFLSILSGEVPIMRVIGTLEPILSGPDIAQRVREQVLQDGATLQDRPAARTYLAGHMARMFAGHEKDILLQEPGMAILVNPKLIDIEEDVEFTTDALGGADDILKLRRLAKEEIDEDDRATLIPRISEASFWDLLVHVRSRDWAGFCDKTESKSDEGTHDVHVHDEL